MANEWVREWQLRDIREKLTLSITNEWVVFYCCLQCIGQELDPEDVAVFTINPLAQEGKGKANVHVIVSLVFFVMCFIADSDGKYNVWNIWNVWNFQISDPAGSFLLEDKVNLGEEREISKDIKLQGVHQMCFKHKCEFSDWYLLMKSMEFYPIICFPYCTIL